MHDPAAICRLQFGLTASYHIIFPSLIIGLTAYLLVCRVRWALCHHPRDRSQFLFWAKPLVPVFVLAVITGTVLSHQLDHIFSGFYTAAASVLLPVRRIELSAAMLLESGCFAIMVWGWRRVGDRLHLLATILFAMGVVVAAVCILGRNSWMQTPAGYEMVRGKIQAVDWLAVIVSPSFLYRFAHVLGAAFLSTGLVILAVSAWYLLCERHQPFARHGLRNAVLIVGIAAPLQLLSGDLHGLNTREHQPTKLAAIEALWDTRDGAPLVLLAVPDAAHARNLWDLAVPRLASLIITHDLDGHLQGLRAVPAADRPNVPIVFTAFRVMVLCGLAITSLGVAGLILLRRSRLYQTRWFLRACCWALPTGFIGTISGWLVTEAGRQPWVIQGLIRTSAVIDPAAAEGCDRSIAVIGMAYALLSAAFLAALARIFHRGPDTVAAH